DTASGGKLALFVRTLATGEARALAGTETFAPQGSMLWSFDSKQLVLISRRGATAIDVATGVTRPLCDCRFSGGSANRDGTILLGAFRQGNQGIQRTSFGGGAPVLVTRPGNGERDVWPVFLPDGRHFLFTRTENGPLTTAACATW